MGSPVEGTRTRTAPCLYDAPRETGNLDMIAPFPYPAWPDATHLTVINAVAARLANIQIAAGRALGVGGGLVIW